MVATLSVFVAKLLPYFFLWNNVLIHLCDCCFDDTFLLCYNLGAGTANCRGSPMAIALIGGMLRRSCTERKWKAIAEKMEHKHLYLSTKISHWSYEHPTLNASIELRYAMAPTHTVSNLSSTLLAFEVLLLSCYDSNLLW